MSASLLKLGQTLRGASGRYTITAQIQETVWLAKQLPKAEPRAIFGENNGISSPRLEPDETVIVKGVRDHPRVKNERDVLKRFQDRTPYLRRLVDEIEDPPNPTIVALKHLDGDLLTASKRKSMNRKELKSVSRCALEAFASSPRRRIRACW